MNNVVADKVWGMLANFRLRSKNIKINIYLNVISRVCMVAKVAFSY